LIYKYNLIFNKETSPDHRDYSSPVDRHYNSLQEGGSDWVRIIFLQTLAILHELGHLIMRWKGVKDSPDSMDKEAGYYLEKLLFAGETEIVYLHNEVKD